MLRGAALVPTLAVAVLVIAVAVLAAAARIDNTVSSPKPSLTAYLFLGESCPVSQYYTLPLKDLHHRYDHRVRFVGVFSNPLSTAASIDAFKGKYSLPFDLLLDDDQRLARQLEARVTPEAVLVDENDGVLYRGRIDDSFPRIGKRRRVVRSRDLEAALDAAVAGKQVPVAETEAIGCFMTYERT